MPPALRSKRGGQYLYQSAALYSEFTSHASIPGWPLVQIASGRNPQTGSLGTARGIIAIGRKAVGFLAVGQAALGIIAVGQLAIGLVAGIGQAACGILAIGQAAAGVIAVGQFAAGGWIWAQFGLGQDLRPLLGRE